VNDVRSRARNHRLVLWCPQLEAGALRSRLAVADGVEPAPAAGCAVAFEDGALVPREPWRAPTDDEFARLAGETGAPDFASTLGIVACPQVLVARARDIFLGRESGRIAPTEARRLREALGRDIAAWIDEATGWRVDGAVHDVSMFHNDPGKPTVSFDPDTGLHVGLHMDSFDRRPDHLRDRASNRFSINLGEQTRYFLFVDREAVGLLDGLARCREPRPAPARLATRYLQTYPGTPVWRLCLQPGEAYFAPTENIIHDGSSHPMSARDIHCTLRGYFLPAAGRREPPARPAEIRVLGQDGSLHTTTVDAAAPASGAGVALPDAPSSPWLRRGTAVHHVHPFPLWEVDGAIDPVLAGTLYGWLAALDDWCAHPDAYYDVDQIDLLALEPPAGLACLFAPEALACLRAQLGQLWGHRFQPRMRVVAHRMGAGQGAGLHNDDPRGVEETHRMVLTLGQDASRQRGGLFAVFDSPSPDGLVHAWSPAHNQCLLFEANARSWHAITEVRYGLRYSVVLSFWRDAGDAPRGRP
jgi:hypothetical protein